VALIEFFKAGVLEAPRAVTSATHPDTDQVGFVTPSFDAGAVVLKNESDEFFRLEWPRTDHAAAKKTDRPHAAMRRPLPPGKYSVTNYRVARPDKDGHEWFVSATGKNIRQFEITAGQTHRLDLKAEIAMNCRAKSTAGGVTVQAMIMGEHHAGLTIYRDGKRIPMRFAVLDKSGKEVAAGELEYG
jgi:hypothetical protein